MVNADRYNRHSKQALIEKLAQLDDKSSDKANDRVNSRADAKSLRGNAQGASVTKNNSKAIVNSTPNSVDNSDSNSFSKSVTDQDVVVSRDALRRERDSQSTILSKNTRSSRIIGVKRRKNEVPEGMREKDDFAVADSTNNHMEAISNKSTQPENVVNKSSDQEINSSYAKSRKELIEGYYEDNTNSENKTSRNAKTSANANSSDNSYENIISGMCEEESEGDSDSVVTEPVLEKLRNEAAEARREAGFCPPQQQEPSEKSPFQKIFYKIWIVPFLGIILGLIAFLVNSTFFQQQRSYIGPLKAQESQIFGFESISPAFSELSRCNKIPGYSDPEVEAGAYLVFFVDDFQIVAEKNIDQQASFASISKLLGILVSLDHYDLDQEISLLEKQDTYFNGLDLELEEKVFVRDLIGAALVGSRNDAMYTLAQNFPGGRDAFIEAMNSKANSLGMYNTMIANEIGIDDENQYSTPYDIAILSTVSMRNDIVAELVSMPYINISTSLGRSINIKNTNPLIGEVYGVKGLKTGYTGNAGLCLVTYVEDKQDFIVIVLNAQDRAIASQELINWVRSNYVCE